MIDVPITPIPCHVKQSDAVIASEAKQSSPTIRFRFWIASPRSQ
jgi:hypothetical protein